MKYIKTYEDIKSYYDFDAIKFWTNFKLIFINEIKSNVDNEKSSEFFNILAEVIHNIKNILDRPTRDLAVLLLYKLINNILQYKKVSFYDLSGDINEGIVRDIKFDIINSTDYRYEIDLYGSLVKYGYPEGAVNFISVDYDKPVKIYSEPTKIEKFIELNTNANKYNL